MRPGPAGQRSSRTRRVPHVGADGFRASLGCFTPAGGVLPKHGLHGFCIGAAHYLHRPDRPCPQCAHGGTGTISAPSTLSTLSGQSTRSAPMQELRPPPRSSSRARTESSRRSVGRRTHGSHASQNSWRRCARRRLLRSRATCSVPTCDLRVERAACGVQDVACHAAQATQDRQGYSRGTTWGLQGAIWYTRGTPRRGSTADPKQAALP